MMKSALLFGVMLAVALDTAAMPEQSELRQAQEIISELMAPKLAEYKSKKLTAGQLGDYAMENSKEAESEAGKFVLLKGAIAYYAKAGEYGKVVKAFENLRTAVKDIPVSTQEEILSKAMSKPAAKQSAVLLSLYQMVKTQADGDAIVGQLSSQVLKTPGDMKLRRRYAEAIAASGKWGSALIEFSKTGSPISDICKKEIDGGARNSEIAEFWWSYKPLSADFGSVFKFHAVDYYRKAITADEIRGLQKKVVLQRIASCSGDVCGGVKIDCETSHASVGEDCEVGLEEPKCNEKREGVDTITTGLKILGGTQTAKIIELKKGPVSLKTEYVVPLGSELIIGAGVTILAEEGAGITIDGSLRIKGNERHPVFFRPVIPGKVSWRGITLRPDSSADIENMIITGASNALFVRRSKKLKLSKSLFSKNGAALDIERSGGSVEDCIFCDNNRNAVTMTGAHAVFDHCTILNNRGEGITGETGVTVNNTIVEGNEKGLHCWFKPNVSANNCSFCDNRRYDVEMASDNDWNFTACYWGAEQTKILNTSGASVNLKTIRDGKDMCGVGHVKLDDYLKSRPKGCGARVAHILPRW